MQVGFDSLYFARIDYQDRAKRKTERSLEFIWQGSKSLGSSAQVILKNYYLFHIIILLLDLFIYSWWCILLIFMSCILIIPLCFRSLLVHSLRIMSHLLDFTLKSTMIHQLFKYVFEQELVSFSHSNSKYFFSPVNPDYNFCVCEG